MNDATFDNEGLLGPPPSKLNVEDVREIKIEAAGDRLVAKAFFNDGYEMRNFKGYWYGWQLINGKAPMWTPLGYGENSIQKPSHTNFASIQVYKYPQGDENVSPSNTFGIWTFQ
jgi:hypothetical protein